VLSNVSVSAAGIYSVVMSGVCGNAVTNSATLTVNASTVAMPLTSLTNNLGTSVTFATAASGTSSLTYVWKKNGTNVTGATTASLTLTNLTYADDATYSVEVSGTCNTAVQAATLTINHPPTVSILSPTNGAVFISPADFTVLADAEDVDGTVTNVEFFLWATNLLGQVTNAPYFVVLTNVPTGTYTFTAVATDNLGASGTSAPVSISVITQPPLSVVSSIGFNPRTGYYEQTVRVTNPTYSTYNAVRVCVCGLTTSQHLSNASGFTNGVPYAESSAAIPPGTYVDLLLEYYVTDSSVPNPLLVPQLVAAPSVSWGALLGTLQHINRGLMLVNRTFMVEFTSNSNRLYAVEYSSNLQNWNTAQPLITGNGTWVQWLDNGQPTTVSSPAATTMRFYRVILLP
jgi:hypothetical protein